MTNDSEASAVTIGPLEALWNGYVERILPVGLPESVVYECRQAFYGGAAIMGMKEERGQEYAAICEELAVWSKEFRQRHYPDEESCANDHR